MGKINASPRWRQYWRKVFEFDRRRMEPWVALRNAIGVVAPMAIGVSIGMPLGGLAVSTGALQVSYSDSAGPYAQRARKMLAASVLCALAVVAGGLAVKKPILAWILIVSWAFGAGFVACLGPAAESLGVISLVTLIIYSVQPLTPRRTLLSGLLALAGGLLQMGLALFLWPLRRYVPERRALASLYLELSQAAITPAGSGGPPVSERITATRESLAGLSKDMSLEAERYWSLLNQAERIRLRLLALRRLRKRLEREAQAQPIFETVDEYVSVAAEILATVATSLSDAKPAAGAQEPLLQLRALRDAIRRQETMPATPFVAALVKDTRIQVNALTGQLQTVVRTTTETTPAELRAFAIRDARQPWPRRFSGSLAKLRANLTLQSSAFRHAVRLTACIALGEVIAHQLHNRRSYWLAMTIVLVLKQEFATTFSRGLLRIVGTVLGLVFATAWFHFMPPGLGMDVLMAGVLVFLLRSAGAANYGVFTIAISALVVVMFAVAGIAPSEVVMARGEMTLIGGVIALATYLVWPTWERTQVSEMLARLLDAYRSYFQVIANTRIQGRPADEAALGPVRLAARLARSNLEASVDRLRTEPGVSQEQIDLWTALLANSHRFARASMALETVSADAIPARPEFSTFASDVAKTLDLLSSAIRNDAPTKRSLPDLRECHHRLVNSSPSEISRYALVNEETDRMTNSLNTLTEQVRHWELLRKKQ